MRQYRRSCTDSIETKTKEDRGPPDGLGSPGIIIFCRIDLKYAPLVFKIFSDGNIRVNGGDADRTRDSLPREKYF